jgi:hypothetical protein
VERSCSVLPSGSGVSCAQAMVPPGDPSCSGSLASASSGLGSVTDPGHGYPHEASLMIVSVHGIIHSIISLFFVFILLPAVCFVLARRYAADPALRGWAWYAVITGPLVVVFVVLTIVATPLNGPAGLTQRIFIIVGWSWIAVLAIRLMSRSVPLA